MVVVVVLPPLPPALMVGEVVGGVVTAWAKNVNAKSPLALAVVPPPLLSSSACCPESATKGEVFSEISPPCWKIFADFFVEKNFRDEAIGKPCRGKGHFGLFLLRKVPTWFSFPFFSEMFPVDIS